MKEKQEFHMWLKYNFYRCKCLNGYKNGSKFLATTAADGFLSCKEVIVPWPVWLSRLASSHKVKGHRFGTCARGNQSVFLSHMDVSLPLFLPPFSSL